MKNLIYIYNQPFCTQDTPSAREEYLLEYLAEDDRLDERRIHATLLKFALTHDLVAANDDHSLQHSTNDDTGSWVWAVNWMNFRSLVDHNQYVKLMQALQAQGGEPINQLIDLHARLGSLFDPRLLSTLTNRTINSFSLIPYEVPAGNKVLTWQNIHTETPFVWILMLLQVVIRSEVKR